MTKINLKCTPDLRCQAVHESSGAIIITDAQKEYGGTGEAFSATDLVAIALGNCIVTTVMMAAKKSSISVEDIHASVKKEMTKSPIHRVGLIHVIIEMKPLSSEDRVKLE